MKKIYLLKFLDVILGKLLCILLPKYSATQAVRPHYKRMLFIRPGGIGDAVLLLPAIIYFKQRNPAVTIDVLAEKRNSAIFSLCSEVSSVLHYDRPMELLSIFHNKYDIVIDSEQWHRLSAVVARLTRAKMTIGYSTNERRRLFTHSVHYDQSAHEAANFLKLLAPLAGSAQHEASVPFLIVPSEISCSVKPMLFPLSGRPVVALFQGGSIQQKKWDLSRFHSLAEVLIQRGYGIVVVGGKEDKESGEKIVGELPRSINLCGKLTLVETAAILNKASLLISGDSGIMHIAYGLGTSVVALFGPSNPGKWAPMSSTTSVVKNNTDCSPCSKFGYIPYCRRNVACMNQITVDEVVAAAINLLER